MKRKTLPILGLLLVLTTSIAFAQPANDNCADAQSVLLDDMVAFSTIGATTDGPFHPNSPCPSSASDSIFSDIWFSHTATITGELRWSLCGMADFDSRIAVYQAGSTCPLSDIDLLACNEDGPAACTNFESELDFDVIAGQTYLMRLGGFGAAEPGAQGSGSFTLTEVPFGPANNACDDAIPITLGLDQPISNVDATTDGPSHPNDFVCFGFGDNNCQNDIWYTFTSPVTSTIEWSTCNQVNWDSRLVVYGPNVDCNVTPDDMIACSDATAGCAGFTNILHFDAIEGETYLMRVGGYNGATGSGVFDLIEIAPLEPPANDECAAADSVWLLTPTQADDFDVIFEGTVINSTISSGIIDPSCGDGNGGKFPDVWFKFDNLGHEAVEIRCIAEEPGTGFILEVFENCDGDTIAGNSCFRFTPDDFDILIDTITGLSSDPTEYWIRVSGWLFWPPGAFWFQLVGDPVVNVDEAVFPGEVVLSPNPTGGKLNVEMNLSEFGEANLQVFNVLGEKVMHEKRTVVKGSQNHTLNAAELANGVYTLIASVGNARRVLKFTKI